MIIEGIPIEDGVSINSRIGKDYVPSWIPQMIQVFGKLRGEREKGALGRTLGKVAIDVVPYVCHILLTHVSRSLPI